MVKTISNLLIDKNTSQFILEPVTQLGEGNPNLFTINPHNPQQVLIKGSPLTFLSNNNLYTLNDPDLSNFITSTEHDNIKNTGMKYYFSHDMNYDLNYGDKNQIDLISLNVYFNPN